MLSKSFILLFKCGQMVLDLLEFHTGKDEPRESPHHPCVDSSDALADTSPILRTFEWTHH